MATFQEFVEFAEQSELMAKISEEKRQSILAKYKDATPEQIDGGIADIKAHEERWRASQEAGKSKVEQAEQKMHEAIQTAPKRKIEAIHTKENSAKKNDEEVLKALENDLNNL